MHFSIFFNVLFDRQGHRADVLEGRSFLLREGSPEEKTHPIQIVLAKKRMNVSAPDRALR